ncbi:MAG: hypothetical protein DSZ12_07075 [Sulfurovum sp.]|nr:MAG: hypothetical protein DSZ12_07075 [Sulfurovum sp.]
MIIQKQEKVSSKDITVVNAYTNTHYQTHNAVIQPLDTLLYDTSKFVATFMHTKDIIITSIFLSKSIQEKDIAESLEIKVYEELDLDPLCEYVIAFIEKEEKEPSNKEREFQVFIAQKEYIEIIYASIEKDTKYIDLILPAPLLYSTLYKRDILDNKDVDCFIYFSREDTSVTLYENGLFLYAKSITYSLEQMYDKYCELVDQKIEKEAFYTRLKKEGLHPLGSQDDKILIHIFTEVFKMVHDIFTYVKRAFSIDKIDNIYLGSSEGKIIDLQEYSQGYLGIKTMHLHTIEDDLIPRHLPYLMQLCAYDYMEDETRLANLTIYQRPLSFSHRAGGQWLIAFLSVLILGLVYPLWHMIDTSVNHAAAFKLNKQNKALQIEASQYKQRIDTKQKEILLLDKKIAKNKIIYQNKSNVLTTIYHKKVNYQLKSTMIYAFTAALSKFDIKTDKLSSKKNIILISLLSPSDENIAQLMKYISGYYKEKIKKVDIGLIEKDKRGYYKGLLKVELK